MQISPSFKELKLGVSPRVSKALSWSASLLILIIICHKLDAKFFHEQLLNDWQYFELGYLAFVLLLLPINIFLEAFKWKILCASFERKGYLHYFKLILSGRSSNVLTPFGIGDGTLKIATVDEQNRVKALVSLGIARFTQFVSAAIGGVVSSFTLLDQGVEVGLINLHWWIIALGVSFCFLALFFIYKKLKRAYYSYFQHVDFKLVLKAFVISLLRYAVFSFQFYLVFLACGVEGEFWILISGVFWIFFIKTIVPNLTVLGDLVKREISALLFFSVFMIEIEPIALANLVIWLINMVLPAVIGVFFIPNLTRIAS